MHLNGAINSVFIMSLTKEQLINAHDQGLVINTRNGNLKIVAILNDIYGVNHFNSNKVQWWMFENFERNQATIEQPKPKIDLSILKEGEIYFGKTKNSQVVFKYKNIDTEIHSYAMYFIGYNTKFTNCNMCDVDNITELRLPTESELELFYSRFPELKPKKYIQGFEVGKNYNDVVFVSDSHLSINTSFPNVSMRILKEVREDIDYPFIMHDNSMFAYARYPHKEEINEIKFID
jgi:hypothetical protein